MSMTDLGPDDKKSLAKRLRMLGTPVVTERRNAFAALERFMHSKSVSWSDIGNLVEEDKKPVSDECKYTESDLQQWGQVQRAEGVEAGIKIGEARKSNGGGNGHIALPKPADMAEYCHERLGRLKDDKQREFVTDMYSITQRGKNLSPGRLGYLASIYIQIGGRI
jgi:hypothetical protein